MKTDISSLHSVGLHEAGHAAVARYYGHATHWQVMLVSGMASGPDSGPYWRGRTLFYGGKLGASPERRIGLAGVVAELLHENPDLCPYAVDDYLHNEIVEMTQSDWDLVGDYRIRDIRDTIRLVGRMMPGIQWEAEQVVREHVSALSLEDFQRGELSLQKTCRSVARHQGGGE